MNQPTNDSLGNLMADYERKRATFVAACVSAGLSGPFDYYRRLEAGESFPSVDAAWQESNAAIHRYYSARDGDGGFLGSRGL